MTRIEEANLFQLPDDVLTSIFLKLPIPTLFHCKYVCKSWRRWFSSPNFTKTLFSQTRNTWVLIRGRNPISSEQCFNFLVNMENPTQNQPLLIDIQRDYIPYNLSVGLKLPQDPNLPSRANLLGSCNGLLLLEDCITSRYYISNPMTAESLALLPCINDDGRNFQYSHAGIAITHVCRVILMSPTNGTGMSSTVNGSGIWRSIQNYKQQNTHPQHLVHLNGLLHWIIDWRKEDKKSTISICAFDVDQEQFGRVLEAPSTLMDKQGCRDLKLQIWRGCLSLVACNILNISLWVMKDYGITGSWTKLSQFKSLTMARYPPYPPNSVDYMHASQFKKWVERYPPNSVEDKQAYIVYHLHVDTIKTMERMRWDEVIKGIPSNIDTAIFEVYTPTFILISDMII